MPTPKWNGRRWRIQVRHEGRRVSFSSSISGQKGRRDCQRKYDNWYYGEATGEKTVGRVAAEYLEDLKARCGENSASVQQNSRYIALYVLPMLSERKICKVTLREWQKVINEATGRNKALSEKTLQNLRGIIMAIIKFGYEDYQCEMPRGKLYIPKGHSKNEKEILQRDEVKRLLEPSDLFYYPLFKFLLLTGMRPSEALGLQIGDYDGETVTIRRAVNAQGFITEGKNKNARRMIPLGSMAKEVLDETISRNEKLNLRTEWIFCSKDGSKGNQSTMRNQWLTLKKERGLSGTVYSLRHTFISFMKNVMPEQMIKDIVGHSKSFDSFSVYGHILDNEKEQAADIIDLTFGQSVTQMSPKEKVKTPKAL